MEEKQKNKNSKVLIGVIIALSLVVCGLGVGLVFTLNGKDNEKSSTTDTEITTEVEPKDTEATDDEAASEDMSQDKAEEDKQDCYISVVKSNGWESNNGMCGQLDITIYNNSNEKISNWSVVIPVDAATSLDSSWNGNCELKDSKINITSVDYNNEILPSSNVKDIGIIVTVADESEFDKMISSAELYVDGKLYKNEAKPEENNEAANDEEDGDIKATASKPVKAEEGTPFDNHGKLVLDGVDIVDCNGEKYQLKGVSTHGIAWFPEYVNKDAFKSLRDDWGANLIRIAMYTDEYGGYCNGGDKAQLKNLVDTGVNSATELGMYVIIDWHILHDLNPQVHKDEAKAFFEEVSEKYKDYDNVIYEICNEPNGGTSWEDVKAYAEEVIPIIRKNAKDAIIIVGTPNWSQDVDVAAENPVTGYDNIMYAVHFYAATHTDSIRNKVTTALDKGLPVFVSEFSICDASGNGGIDYSQADKWFELIGKNNLSYAGWSLSNKEETASLIKSSCTKTSDWSDADLSETGTWLKNQIQNN